MISAFIKWELEDRSAASSTMLEFIVIAMEAMETVPNRRCCSVGRVDLVNLLMAFLFLVIVAIAASVIGILGTLNSSVSD